MPAAIIPRSIGTPSLFARILSAKFHMGLPLYRQEELFAGERLPIDRGLMSKWCEELGGILGATIFHAARDEAMKTAFCLSTDATGVLVQPIRSHEKKQSCKKGNFFVVIADRDHVFFDYAARETSAHVMEMFRGYSATSRRTRRTSTTSSIGKRSSSRDRTLRLTDAHVSRSDVGRTHADDSSMQRPSPRSLSRKKHSSASDASTRASGSGKTSLPQSEESIGSAFPRSSCRPSSRGQSPSLKGDETSEASS